MFFPFKQFSFHPKFMCRPSWTSIEGERKKRKISPPKNERFHRLILTGASHFYSGFQFGILAVARFTIFTSVTCKFYEWVSELAKKSLTSFVWMIHMIGILHLPHFLGLLVGATGGFLVEARAGMTSCQISTHQSSRTLAHPEMIPENMNPEPQEDGYRENRCRFRKSNANIAQRVEAWCKQSKDKIQTFML